VETNRKRCSSPFLVKRIRAYPVSTKVNCVKDDNPSLIDAGAVT
jgi:hypothetical protein